LLCVELAAHFIARCIFCFAARNLSTLAAARHIFSLDIVFQSLYTFKQLQQSIVAIR